MDILNKKEEVVGIISASLWASVGDDNHVLGKIESMNIESETYRGYTIPIIEVHGSRATARFNWEHVEAVLFAPPVLTENGVPVPEDE